jgi:hypothetical protein
MRLNDSILKFLPYRMELSILGISDLWVGNRIFLVRCPFSWANLENLYRSTVWRIVDIKHIVENNIWTTDITAITEKLNDPEVKSNSDKRVTMKYQSQTQMKK